MEQIWIFRPSSGSSTRERTATGLIVTVFDNSFVWDSRPSPKKEGLRIVDNFRHGWLDDTVGGFGPFNVDLWLCHLSVWQSRHQTFKTRQMFFRRKSARLRTMRMRTRIDELWRCSSGICQHVLAFYTIFQHFSSCFHMGVCQNLLLSMLVGWTPIYQLFWCSPGL